METKKMTTKERLRELAEDQYGYVTIADIDKLGVPAVEVRKLASRGKLIHVRRGVYRFPDFKPSSRDRFATALAAVGEGSFLIRDSVLALHGLAFVNPNRITVGTTKRIRHELPSFVAVKKYTSERPEIEVYEGLRSTSVAKAIEDSRNLVLEERLQDALKESLRLGLIDRKEYASVRKKLVARAA
jgi:predicted transcriptional regulator of viral defense system